ncbi:MAG: DoxX family protein [Mycobacteriaceae bacterium]
MTPKMRIVGLVLTGLLALFLLFDAVIHIANVDAVKEASQDLGFPENMSPIMGVVLLVSLVLYLIPRTAVLGAVLITAYFGGAVTVHLIHESGIFDQTLFPVYFGIVLWISMYLRDPRVRTLI